MIRNINSAFGDPEVFEDIEEMQDAIMACGYDLPVFGLMEGRDYCIVHKVEFVESGWQSGSGWSYTTHFAPTEYTEKSMEEAKGYYSIEMDYSELRDGEDVEYLIVYDGEVIAEEWQSEINALSSNN